MAGAIGRLVGVNLLLEASIWVHVTAALLALVTMPVLFFAPKGTSRHVLAGRGETVLATTLLVAGAFIVFNPAYVARLQSDVARYGWSPHVSRLLFAWIWGYFFYFFFSSRRIWSRWRAPDLLTAGTPDYVLTGLALLLGGAGR